MTQIDDRNTHFASLVEPVADWSSDFGLIKKKGAGAVEAAILTCSQRLRPVLLTTITTILGLLPMTLGMNFDLINRHIQIGGPSTQWWTQLASAITFGLAFATVLTLVMTPAMLVLGDRIGSRFRQAPVAA